jgi:hypothetical protein
MAREDALEPLVKLAEQSAAAWKRVRAEAFAGETIFETANTRYRFVDGIFSARAPIATEHGRVAWESPVLLKGLELIGFFTDEGGFWSFSPKWREGALAVIAAEGKTFTLTSPTRAFQNERPLAPRQAPTRSDVFDIPRSRPLEVRRPAPPSMTRIQAMPAALR